MDFSQVRCMRLSGAEAKRMDDVVHELGTTWSEYLRGMLALSLALPPLADDCVRRLSTLFDRTRTEVITALVVDHIAMTTAQQAEHPDKPIKYAMFARDALGPLESAALLAFLLPRHIAEVRALAGAKPNPKAPVIIPAAPGVRSKPAVAVG